VVKDDLVKAVEVLLDGGSQDLSKIDDGSGRQWMPLKLARYHRVYEMVKDKLAPPIEVNGSKKHGEPGAVRVAGCGFLPSGLRCVFLCRC
jgi:hypothetical protein